MKNEIKITEYKISSNKLPQGFDGFRLAHISDAHSNPVMGILEAVKNAKPDIIVITGDMLHGIKKATDKFDVLLEGLLQIAPVYMVTGNHDRESDTLSAVFDGYEKSGAVMLDDKRVILEKNGDKIALSGIADPILKKRPQILRNIKKSLDKIGTYTGYEVLLFHRANLFDEVRDKGFDLILSGHMHGGQIRLPIVGGLLAPSSSLLGGYRMIFPKYSGGRYKWGETEMLVNAGMSNTLPIPRWNNPCEVGVIVLNHS